MAPNDEMRQVAVLYQQLIMAALPILQKYHAARASYHPLAEGLAKITQWIRRYDETEDKMSLFDDWYGEVVGQADLYEQIIHNWRASTELKRYEELQRTGQLNSRLLDNPDIWAWVQYMEDLISEKG